MAGALGEMVLRRWRMRRPRGLGTNIPGAAQRGPPGSLRAPPRPRVVPTGRRRPWARHVARTLSTRSPDSLAHECFTNAPPVPTDVASCEPSWVGPSWDGDFKLA